jgi:outer membrane protein OmpA-like peptidoglycan-associated protein
LPDLPPQETPKVAEAPPTPDPKPAPQDQGMAQAPAPQQAALPPTAMDQLTVPFAPDSADPPRDAVRSLSTLAAMLAENDALRLRLNAYAPGATAEESRSRRLSLSRALAVRSRLVDAGISSTRIEVRALGNAATEGPLDRVDVIVLER